ncbi:unnamed protein product [Triticum turgidum subsp. durum]|uniref:Uncharacterized protein n=1 Tax=Triticum turgidum subsp. durum TaxID=4567 RepID=A0A9R1NQJ9_TRITD|nr:unnamed protein product [Triticum turgidum subsp. durum]
MEPAAPLSQELQIHGSSSEFSASNAEGPGSYFVQKGKININVLNQGTIELCHYDSKLHFCSSKCTYDLLLVTDAQMVEHVWSHLQDTRGRAG